MLVARARGAYRGAALRMLSERCPGCDVAGMVATCHRRRHAPEPGGAHGRVLDHLVDPWSALRLVRSLLAPGGVVVASIPNLRQWRLVAKLALGRWTYVSGAGTVQRGHVRFFTRQTVTDMFVEAGYAPPTYHWPRRTFHLRPADRVANRLTAGAIPDLLYGSYTVSAAPRASSPADG